VDIAGMIKRVQRGVSHALSRFIHHLELVSVIYFSCSESLYAFCVSSTLKYSRAVIQEAVKITDFFMQYFLKSAPVIALRRKPHAGRE
jgi:hypothetical protein